MYLMCVQRQWDSVVGKLFRGNNTSQPELVKMQMPIGERQLFSLNNISKNIQRPMAGRALTHAATHHVDSSWDVLYLTLWYFTAACRVLKWDVRRRFMQMRQHKVRCCYFWKKWLSVVVLKIEVWGTGLFCFCLRRVQTKGESKDQPVSSLCYVTDVSDGDTNTLMSDLIVVLHHRSTSKMKFQRETRI